MVLAFAERIDRNTVSTFVDRLSRGNENLYPPLLNDVLLVRQNASPLVTSLVSDCND